MAAQTGAAKPKPSAAKASTATKDMPPGLRDLDDKDIKLGVDEPGCKDPALFPRVAGCSIIQCDNKDFAAAAVHVGATPEGGVDTETKEGPMEVIYYLCPSRVSLSSIVKQGEGTLVKGGWRALFSGKDEDDQPIATLVKDTQFVEISTYTYNQYSAYVFTAVEDLPEVTAESLAEELMKTGRVPLDSIAFAKEKFELPSTADRVLEVVIALLKEKPDWKIKIESHAADAADKQANLTLSEKRASAVVGWLVASGVERERIASEALGDAAAKNKIELVKAQ